MTDTDIEVVADLSKADARALTDRINAAAVGLWELVVTAYQGRAWVALGYNSWDAYTDAEFADVRLALPREKRKETVASLRDAGLSMRAIAAATGVGRGTVERDISARVPNGTPEPEPVTGKDGKVYRRPPARRAPAKKPPRKTQRRKPQRTVPYGNGWMVGRFDFEGGDTPDNPALADKADGGVMPGAYDIDAFIYALATIIGTDPIGDSLPTLGVLDHAYSTADSEVERLTLEAEQAQRLRAKMSQIITVAYGLSHRLSAREADAKAEIDYLKATARPTLVPVK